MRPSLNTRKGIDTNREFIKMKYTSNVVKVILEEFLHILNLYKNNRKEYRNYKPKFIKIEKGNLIIPICEDVDYFISDFMKLTGVTSNDLKHSKRVYDEKYTYTYTYTELALYSLRKYDNTLRRESILTKEEVFSKMLLEEYNVSKFISFIIFNTIINDYTILEDYDSYKHLSPYKYIIFYSHIFNDEYMNQTYSENRDVIRTKINYKIEHYKHNYKSVDTDGYSSLTLLSKWCLHTDIKENKVYCTADIKRCSDLFKNTKYKEKATSLIDTMFGYSEEMFGKKVERHYNDDTLDFWYLLFQSFIDLI